MLYCPLCDFTNNRAFHTTECKHKFHVDCLNKWYEYKQNCPTCDKEIEFPYDSQKADGFKYPLNNLSNIHNIRILNWWREIIVGGIRKKIKCDDYVWEYANEFNRLDIVEFWVELYAIRRDKLSRERIVKHLGNYKESIMRATISENLAILDFWKKTYDAGIVKHMYIRDIRKLATSRNKMDVLEWLEASKVKDEEDEEIIVEKVEELSVEKSED